MVRKNKLALSEFSARSGKLIEKARGLLVDLGCEDVSLPESMPSEERPITIVFAGQYSAGKSTILKALTGMDIEIGHGVTTQVATSYEWNGLRVVDTPGIRTGLREDHDEISLKAISEADALVYVVKYDGFDPIIASEFRRLLIDLDKAKEMILVVNQMGRANDKNSPAQREIIANDLAKVTAPYTPDQLHTVFIDAKSYLRGLDAVERDAGKAERLFEQGNFDDLIDALNAFVAKRGIALRLTTPLYQLRESLDSALQMQDASSGDDDIDALEDQLIRERSILRDSMNAIRHSVRHIYRGSAIEIREEGRKLAEGIDDCRSESDAEDLAKKACNRVDEIAERCNADIVETVNSQAQQCSDILDELFESDFSVNLQLRLSKKRDTGNPLVNRVLQPDLFTRGSMRIAESTVGSDVAATGLRAFSGSEAHQLVLKVGHYFGHSFKPWEAVKWAKGIGVAGKTLGVLGVVLSFGLQMKDDYEQDKIDRERRKNRENIRASFNGAADSLEELCGDALQKLLSDDKAFQPRIDEINRQLEEIAKLRQENSVSCKKLALAIEECSGLIVAIHRYFLD